MRANGGGTTSSPRLVRGAVAALAGGSAAATSVRRSCSVRIGEVVALLPFAPSRFAASRSAELGLTRAPPTPARAWPGTTAERHGELGARWPGLGPYRRLIRVAVNGM